MDPIAAEVVELARGLIDIDSTSGREAEATGWLAARLRERGYHVVEQPVEGDRVNLIAAVGLHEPELVFSTPIDCVPPFFPSRVEGNVLYGRGACDAKGILAAEIAALDRLRAAGEKRAGLLVVVGEERGSHGAHAANRIANRCRYLIDGEPTGNRLGAALRGVYRIRLAASGRAAHSAYPELGDSAIEKLIDALQALRELDLPSDPDLGRTSYTVGLISGGVAPNVVPAAAAADVNFRIVGPAADVRARLNDLPGGVAVEEVMTPPDAADHRVRLRHRRLLVHRRRPVPHRVGTAAAARPRLDSRRAHRRRARRHGRADPGGRSVREAGARAAGGVIVGRRERLLVATECRGFSGGGLTAPGNRLAQAVDHSLEPRLPLLHPGHARFESAHLGPQLLEVAAQLLHVGSHVGPQLLHVSLRVGPRLLQVGPQLPRVVARLLHQRDQQAAKADADGQDGDEFR